MSRLDEIVCRRGTCCAKWDGHAKMGVPKEAIPLWVADMDFHIPDEVSKAIRRRAEHEIYGYTFPPDSYFQSIAGWMKRRHKWEIETDWIVTVPGVIPAINLAINTFTDKGDGILIQRPVYPPFTKLVLGNVRNLVNNPLVLHKDRYIIDFDDFEQKIIDNKVKLFVLCSPHNPVGRIWSREELQTMGEICLRHNVLIVSDEIHQDLIFPDTHHHPMAGVDPNFTQNTIVCTAPSKTFNIAGLQASNTIIPDEKLRQQFAQAAACWGLGKINALAMVATEAAYTHGDRWLDEVMAYVQGNMEFARDFLRERLPQIKLTRAEGLYLLWLDFRSLGFTAEELEDLLLNKARLWLNQGYTFGEEGAGFARLNIGCSRKLLATALNQLEQTCAPGTVLSAQN